MVLVRRYGFTFNVIKPKDAGKVAEHQAHTRQTLHGSENFFVEMFLPADSNILASPLLLGVWDTFSGFSSHSFSFGTIEKQFRHSAGVVTVVL